MNRGKRSLTLDLKSEAGQTVLARLLDRADAFVHNLGPASPSGSSLAGNHSSASTRG